MKHPDRIARNKNTSDFILKERANNENDRISLIFKEINYTNQHTIKEDKIKLALIDSRSLTRMSLSHLLEMSGSVKRRSGDFTILPYSSSKELLAHSPEHGNSIGLIILNIGSACASDDKVCKDIYQLKQELPDVPLVLISERDECDCVLKALRYGVHSYIPATLTPPVVIQALRLILSGGAFIPASAFLEGFEKVSAHEDQNQLDSTHIRGNFTPRQMEVLQLLQKGRSNKIIAYELNMQESTVKVHVRHIMKKLKAINRTHAVFLASQIIEGKLSIKPQDLEPVME